VTATTPIDDYLAELPDDQRAALERLRGLIRQVVPDATEMISYQIPTFKQGGVAVVAFAAFRRHCSFFPMGAGVLAAHRDELAAFECSKGTIRFTPDHPMPAALVKKLVRARVRENEERARARQAKRQVRKR
jgi:uncharacterized protein YdhG (YjbR/CyaY superfamily)